MVNWDPVLYTKKVKSHTSNNTSSKFLEIVKNFYNKPYPIILTLGHLSFRTGIAYGKLNSIIKSRLAYYTFYKIKKRSGKEYRTICNPHFELLQIQKWINKYILQTNKDKLYYSYAFIKGKSTKHCALIHTESKFLIKLDIKNYFDSISEIKVYNYFNSLGYSKLVSFQLARLCTIPFGNSLILYNKKNTNKEKRKLGKFLLKKKKMSTIWNYKKYSLYRNKYIGHLPQGAPTSPMLANLITAEMDCNINDFLDSLNLGLVYTRYADDIFISSCNSVSKEKIPIIINGLKKILFKNGFEFNLKKTKIFKNGSRKEILGINVNSKEIHLPQRFKKNLECHLYYFNKDPINHANKRNFETLIGLINYLNGLISYAKYIEPSYIDKLRNKGLLPNQGFLKI